MPNNNNNNKISLKSRCAQWELSDWHRFDSMQIYRRFPATTSITDHNANLWGSPHFVFRQFMPMKTKTAIGKWPHLIDMPHRRAGGQVGYSIWVSFSSAIWPSEKWQQESITLNSLRDTRAKRRMKRLSPHSAAGFQEFAIRRRMCKAAQWLQIGCKATFLTWLF